VANKLLHKAAMRLRMEKFHTATLAVTLKYALTNRQMLELKAEQKKVKQHSSGIQQTGWAMEARFRPCNDTLSLLDALKGIWKQAPQGALYEKPFFVGVTLKNLIQDDDVPAMLFEEPGNRAQLSSTMDKLNLKYGHSTLHFAGMMPARDAAPTRIAFTQIPVQYGNEYL